MPDLRHYEIAARRTGLATLTGPIYIDDLDRLKVETSRLARLIERHDA